MVLVLGRKQVDSIRLSSDIFERKIEWHSYSATATCVPAKSKVWISRRASNVSLGTTAIPAKEVSATMRRSAAATGND